MKTKTLFIFTLFAFLIQPVFAQKSKAKNLTFKYISLPSEKLPDDFNTYSVKVYGSGISQANLRASSLANGIKMDAFKRLDGSGSNFGHLRTSVYAGYSRVMESNAKSEKKTKKDKDGKVVDSWTEYYYEVTLGMSGNYKIVDPEGNYLVNEGYNPRDTKTTGRARTRSAARENYNNAISGMRATFTKNSVNSLVRSANAALRNKFDFAKQSKVEEIWIVKKHASEDGFESGYESVKAFYKEANGTESSADIKAKLGRAMEFWKKTGEKKPGTDKKAKKVYQAANYNYALMSYYTDDMDSAETYANMVLQSEEKDRRASDLLKRIQTAKDRMALHGVNTMHFTRDVSNAMAPSKVKEFEEIQEEIEEENNTSGGTITINGSKMEGKFAQDKEAADLAFGPKGNTKFLVSSDDGIKEYDLSGDDISSFAIGERKFIKMNFAPSAKGESNLEKHILEELYVSQKIRLYKYYPSAGALGDQKVEFAFLKGADENPTSLMSTQFLLFNKGMAKYFDDCADLKTMAAEGGFKMNKDDLIKAARIYSELCE